MRAILLIFFSLCFYIYMCIKSSINVELHLVSNTQWCTCCVVVVVWVLLSNGTCVWKVLSSPILLIVRGHLKAAIFGNSLNHLIFCCGEFIDVHKSRNQTTIQILQKNIYGWIIFEQAFLNYVFTKTEKKKSNSPIQQPL